MNKLYKYYLDEREKHFQKIKLNCDERIQKARQGYPIHSDLIVEINQTELFLNQELQKNELGDFLTDCDKMYMIDSQLSEEDAFIHCCNKYNLRNFFGQVFCSTISHSLS